MEYVIDLPDSINPNDVALSFSLTHTVAISTEKTSLRDKVISLTTQLNEATAALNSKQQQLDTAASEIAVKRDLLDSANATIAKLEKQVADLTAAAHPAPPVIVTPPAPSVVSHAPVITKTKLANMAGITMTLDDEPSPEKEVTARDLVKLVSSMGFNTIRYMRNKEEMEDDLKDIPGCLTTFAQSNNLTVVYDSLDFIALHLTVDADLKAYMDGIKKLGGKAGYFNDANQYREEKDKITGKLIYPPGTLEKMVARVRTAAPDLPLIASVRASATIADYKPLFDFVEFQTFGNASEFDHFLTLPVDVLCLDGQPTAKASYLMQITDAMLKAHQDRFFVYTCLDTKTNWLNQPATVLAYRTFLTKWWTARQPVLS